ncbi:putative uncharacterized protein C19orf81 isoform X1 [Scyliorhinus canicula]|uniref:putative uncharacterized protein C19orf81 isoform X1 n=1 Tax=Scyliorhinus canicula TaxID=7830 RepID=UPI0018F3D887|nr:putative uncharacterized protein C19orf81 isoform X1 [Scyliorhinus canicula]
MDSIKNLDNIQSADPGETSRLSFNLLSETINATKTGRSTIFKSAKKHLKQFISKYESLDMEMPGIRKFLDTPASQPLTICVECPPDLDLTHQDIMVAVESILPSAFELGKITSIQFENVNVICGSSGLKNRWLINISDFQTRSLLLNSGLVIKKMYMAVQRYDDLLMEDYKLHLRRAMAQKKVLETLNETASLGVKSR